jgi:hypothetical protein
LLYFCTSTANDCDRVTKPALVPHGIVLSIFANACLPPLQNFGIAVFPQLHGGNQTRRLGNLGEDFLYTVGR